MDEIKEFDLEAQDWINVKSHEELEKELLLLKEKLEKEKIEKEMLKKDVTAYLEETMKTLKNLDLANLNTQKLKADNDLLNKKIIHYQKQIKKILQQKKHGSIHTVLLKQLIKNNSEINTLKNTLDQKEEELKKLRPMVTEKKSYAAAVKAGNLSLFPSTTPPNALDPTKMKNLKRG